MSADIYFQLINPLVFLLFAAGHFCVYAVAQSRSSLVIGLSYLCGAGAFGADILNTSYPSLVGVIPTAAIYAVSAAIFSGGMGLRYRGAAPWKLLFAAVAVHVAFYSWLYLGIENRWYRSIEAIAGCGVIFSIGAFHIRNCERKLIDKAIYALYVIFCVQCFLRPLLIVALSEGPLQTTHYNSEVFFLSTQLIVGVSAIMMGMALLIALSLEIVEDLQERSARDALSGLFNRGGFELHAATSLDEADRSQTPVGVIIADIDHFKSVNDAHGHAFGDMVIAELGHIFGEYADGPRIAGRLGGEEFALLLPGETGVAAREVADAIRRDLARIDFQAPAVFYRATASFGVAERQPGEDLRLALARADEALYLAKRDGRNMVRAETDLDVERLKAARDALERRRPREVRPGEAYRARA